MSNFWKFFTLPSTERIRFLEAQKEGLFRQEIYNLTLEVQSLRESNRILLDRILRMATGDGLVVPSEAPPLTAEQKQSIRDAVDAVSNDKPFGGNPSFAQLLQTMEGITFKEDAERQTGYEEIVEGAEVQNAAEEESEEERVRRLNLRKKTMLAAATAQEEYER